MDPNKTGRIAPWVEREMAPARLEDKRLNDRLSKLLSDLGDRPAASIPAACGGHKEMTAAYRFFDNPKVTYAKVLEPHQAATRTRMAQQPVVLLVQDTTEVNLTRPHQQVQGAGPLDGGARRGVLLHGMEAFSPDGTPLGAVSLQIWTRADSPPGPSVGEKARSRGTRPIEQKESFRGLQGLRTARQVAQELSQTQFICIADSEADIHDLFAEPRGRRPVDWLIRAHRDRKVEAETDAGPSTLRERVGASPMLFRQPITVRQREPKISCKTRKRRVTRQRRIAKVQVRAAPVTLPSPKPSLPAASVNVVWVSEPDPPAGEPPVEWILVTTLPIQTPEQVRQILQYYRVRWMIEVLFRTWKSGCRVEWRRFEHLDRLLPCLALYWIVAWRALMLCRLGRRCPERDCQTLLEPAEWQSVWIVTGQGPLPQKPPGLSVMVRLVAQWGGYRNRPRRVDPPGPQTLWLGLQRMHDLAWAWNTFGPGANKDPEDV